MSIGRNTNVEILQANIVVIGGGGAGLTAAVAAAEAGAKDIIVLEKADSAGGNAALAHGIFAVESPAQKRMGVKVTRDEVFLRMMENSHWMVDPGVVRAFVDKTGEIIQWLEDKGLNFENVTGEFLPGGAPFGHALGADFIHSGAVGPRIVETMLKDCQSHGVRILTETPATEILTNGKGRITGVLAKAKDRELKITSKSVIIAAGGFGGNKEMLAKHFPMSAGISGNSLPQMTGDGLLMAEKVGAFIDDYYSILLIGPSYDEKAAFSLGLLLMQAEIVLVNKNGERYCDESLFYNFHNYSGNSLSRQPGKICFALLDAGIKQHLIQHRESPSGFFRSYGGNGAWLDRLESDLQQEAAAGNIKITNSLDEVAGFIGVDSAVLKATVEQYNLYCEKGYDADYLKDTKWLLPLREPPYYVVPGHQNFDTTIGGIRINHRMEVIDKDVRPIVGLYAAGDNAGSWLSQSYNLEHPGSAMAFAISSGHIAGENAAKYIKTMGE